MQDQLKGINDDLKRDEIKDGLSLDVIDKNHQYDVKDKMAVISQEIVVLQSISVTVTGLSTGAINATNGAVKLKEAWLTIQQQQLNEFLAAVNRIPTFPDSFFNTRIVANAGTLEMYSITMRGLDL